MHEWLVYALLAQGELVGGHAQVAFLEVVAANVRGVDSVDEDPEPDVKLPLIYEERSLDVLLYHKHVSLDIFCSN